MSNHPTISIDLAKEIFQVAVFNKSGKVQSNRGGSAARMIKIIAQYPGAKIFMEACGSAHYWARRFTKQGHSVGLIPPHIVAKYRSGNKNDKNDAIAIYEASRAQLYTVLKYAHLSNKILLRYISTEKAARKRGYLRKQAGYTEATLSLSSTIRSLAKWEVTISGTSGPRFALHGRQRKITRGRTKHTGLNLNPTTVPYEKKPHRYQ